MRSGALLVLLLAALLGPRPASAALVTLQYDTFVSGNLAYFQGGFVTGEAAAVTFGPVSDTFTVNKVLLLFGPDDTARWVTLTLWSDAGTATPGAELYSADVEITPASSAMHEIDLSSEAIIVPGPARVRVGIGLQHSGYPAVARDTDGVSARGRSWVRDDSSNWIDSVDAGVPGDWVIRLVVETSGSVVTGCVLPADCGAGEICLNQVCRRVCSETGECGGGEVCFRELCTPACATDGECQGGELCESHVCQPTCTSNVMCQGGEVCAASLCRTICTRHADCAAEEYCDEAACLPGERPPADDDGGCSCGAERASAAPGVGLLLVGGLLRRRRR